MANISEIMLLAAITLKEWKKTREEQDLQDLQHKDTEDR